jgi:hypothetical protein
VLACGARAGLWGDVHLWSMPSLEGRPPSRTLLPGVGLPDG